MNRVKNVGITHPAPKSNYIESLKLRKEVDQFIDTKMLEWKETVPYAGHLESESIHKNWYKRHMIEHVWRIRLMRNAQTRALHSVGKISPEAAQLYARYQDEEMLHDLLFKQDFVTAGHNENEIYETEPFLSTRLLSGFLYHISEHENPIGAICYSYLVEYTTIKLTGKQLIAMKKSLGDKNISGQLSHLDTDSVEDHCGDMWRLLNSLIFTENDEKIVFKYIEEIQYILSIYFKELYSETVLNKKPLSAS